MLYLYSLTITIASSDNNVILTISYYASLNKIDKLIYIYKIKKY